MREDLVAAPLEAATVLTPGDHAPIAIAAAHVGMYVFVEKPACFSSLEGEELLAEAANSAGV